MVVCNHYSTSLDCVAISRIGLTLVSGCLLGAAAGAPARAAVSSSETRPPNCCATWSAAAPCTAPNGRSGRATVLLSDWICRFGREAFPRALCRTRTGDPFLTMAPEAGWRGDAEGRDVRKSPARSRASSDLHERQFIGRPGSNPGIGPRLAPSRCGSLDTLGGPSRRLGEPGAASAGKRVRPRGLARGASLGRGTTPGDLAAVVETVMCPAEGDDAVGVVAASVCAGYEMRWIDGRPIADDAAEAGDLRALSFGRRHEREGREPDATLALLGALRIVRRLRQRWPGPWLVAGHPHLRVRLTGLFAPLLRSRI